MIIANDLERTRLLEAGSRLKRILAAVAREAVANTSAGALNELAERLIREGGDTPAFLGYTPEGAVRPYPATLCVSVNDEVVHGIPNEATKIISEGDIVGLDLGLVHEGIIVDAAVTVAVGAVSDESRRLMRATEQALGAGIAAARVGNRTGDISHAIQAEIEHAGFSVVKALGGHGVGRRVHEEPFVANYGRSGAGEKLVPGLVLALEPIASAGKGAVALMGDGYTFRTKDGSRSAHFEHTVLIEADGPRIIT